LFRDDINKRLHLSAEEMQMAACISGQDHAALALADAKFMNMAKDEKVTHATRA
jgi:hypothetical protein